MLNKFLQSSVNPTELSLKVRGALMTIVPVAGFLLKTLGSEIDQESLKKVVELIGDVVMSVGSIISAGMMIWGIVRSWFAKSST